MKYQLPMHFFLRHIPHTACLLYVFLLQLLIDTSMVEVSKFSESVMLIYQLALPRPLLPIPVNKERHGR